ncbi:MAG: sodium:proton antiporter [Anaerotignum sp.]|nr:sodium:proton antiporter [Anaerotignum sp.]
MEVLTTNNFILPFLVFFPFIGAVVGYGIGRSNKGARDIWAWIVSAAVFAGSLMLIGKESAYTLPSFCGLGISFFADGFGVVLAVLTAAIWLLTTLFSKEYMTEERNRNRYYFFVFLTLGATMGIFLSADLFTTFIFFEIMSFTSFVLVIHEEDDFTIRSAQTYLAVAVLGGLVTLMGLFMMYQLAGTLNLNELTAFMQAQPDKRPFYAIGVLILFGFGAKAGLFPLHVWLPGAYTVAPAPSSALLSCLLTKTGVFGTIIVSCKLFLHDAKWGSLILILGVITMVMGAVLAVFSVNLKRTLACSSMSQIGFIIIAIAMQGLLGEHNALAAAGTFLHFINHSLLKLVLFLSVGVVYMNLRELDLNKVRGFGKDKPLLKIVFLMGLLGIAGVPLWNGYISKTLIHESIVEYIAVLAAAGQSTAWIRCVEVLFLFSGGMTLAYMTKLFVAVFLEDNPYPVERKKTGAYMNKLTAAVLVLSAVILPVFGLLPHGTQDVLAEMGRGFMNAHAPEHMMHYFALENLKGVKISIMVGAVVYFLFIRKVLMEKDANGNLVYVDRWPQWLHIENKIYRPVLLTVLPYIGGFFARLAGSLTDGLIAILRMLIFNDDNGRVIPPEDKYFSAYTGGETDKTVYREGFARSLLMIGIGLTIAMIYILL